MAPRAPYPDDLVTAQRAWLLTYAALAAPSAADPSALRRRLLRLSARVWWHPGWSALPPGWRLPEVRRRARSRPGSTAMAEDMSERQEAILRFLHTHIAEAGGPPVLREIADAVGLSSRSSVHHQLQHPEASGLVVRTGTHHRGYRPA